MADKVNYPDSVTTDSGQIIRITLANQNRMVRIHGRKVRVGDIPLAVFTLECSHILKGIAVQKGDRIFCETCQDSKVVIKSRS